MNEIKLNDRPEELIQAEQFVVEGKFEEAHQLMDKFLDSGEYTFKDSLSCNLLKIDILIQQGLYEDAIKLANQTYKESIKLRENALAFDALNLETQGLVFLRNMDDSLEKIKEGEEFLKIVAQELPREYKKRKAALEIVKVWFYFYKGEVDEVKKHLELCLALLEEIGENQELAYVLLASTMYYAALKGELDIALKYIEKGLEISENINWKYGRALGLLSKGVVRNLQGEVEHSIAYHEQSLTIFKELNNKELIAQIHNNLSWSYFIIGDLERALESIESSINYNKEQGKLQNLANNYDNLIALLIEKDDLERAWKTLEELELLKDQLNNKHTDLLYLYNKAFILKTSPRSRNRIEAEDIFKQIIEDESISYQMIINTLLNLCELLLTELRITNDLSVLEEIDTYIVRLLELAEKGHSFILFTEIYFLKAKLALLIIDLKSARRFLTQAQRIAERFGYSQLVIKISQEHEKLQKQLKMWENLKEKEISLSERMKLAGTEEQMKNLLQNRTILTAQVKEDQITVHKERKICTICKGDILGFIYACICGALYCEKCARALTEIENLCWVCNSPIDISKPIKPYKEEEIEKKDIIKEKFKNHKNK